MRSGWQQSTRKPIHLYGNAPSSARDGEARALTVCREEGDVPESYNRSASYPSFVRCICGVDKRQRSSSDACRLYDRSAAARARPPKPAKSCEVIERDGENTHRSGQLAPNRPGELRTSRPPRRAR